MCLCADADSLPQLGEVILILPEDALKDNLFLELLIMQFLLLSDQ